MHIRSTTTRRSHVPVLLVIAAMLLALLIPVLEGTAQNLASNPTPTPTEAFDPGFAAQPTEEPTREPERTPPTEVPVPTDEPEPAAPSSLTLNKGACDDANFDPSTATGLDAFLDACSSPDGEFEFTVSNGGDFTSTGFTELGTFFTQVPTGTITITETIPDGWDEPAVFCWSNLLPTPSDTPFIGNSPTWDVQEGEDIECWWFNVSEPDGHTIRVGKRVCAEGYVVPTDYWTLASDCQEQVEGVGFALTTTSGMFESATDASGQIEWNGVDLGASGQVQIQEAIPEGYGEPVVWCVNFPVEAADAQDFDFFQVASVDGAVTVSPEQDAPFIFQCTYFNMLAGTGGPDDLIDPAQQEGGEGATVLVTKHRCPLGIPEDLTILEYTELCTAMFGGVGFTLDHPGGSFPGETGEDGQIQWFDVPTGEISIQEAIPEGYKDPLFACNISSGKDGLGITEGVATGGLIQVDVPDGATVVNCTVINIPDPELATSLTVNKWRCHPAFDEETDDPEVSCTTPMDGVTFQLGGLEATTGEGAPGQAVFLDVPTGDHTLSESPTEEIDHAFITGCTVNGEAVPLLVPLSDFPSIGITIEAGEHWVCEWYNVPKAENRVAVHKYLCDPGLDLILTDANTIAEILDSCPTEGNGIEFTLANADGSSTQAIANGATWWDGVPVGHFTVTESIPDGYGEPIVYCQTNTVDEDGDFMPGTWHQVPAPGGVIAGQMGAEYFEVFACHVLNVPADDDGNMTVMKWMCPGGYDVHAEGADPATDCTEPAADIQFQFGQPGLGGEAVLQDIGDVIEGGVRFTNLEPGSWQLVEFAPEGVANAFIGSCVINGVPVPGDPPLHEGFELDFEIEAGQTILCHMYNVPDGDNDLDIFKWLCPEGFDPNSSDEEYFDTCTQALDGIGFEATSDLGIAVLDTVGGMVGFGGFPAGTNVEIQELTPDEYDDSPYVICEFGDGEWHDVGAQSGFFEIYFAGSGESVECHVFNFHGETSITIEKYLCPVGYDLDAPMADPVSDCTDLLDGVTFTLADGVMPDPDQSRQTGDDGPGTVVFTDLEPGTWTVTEEVLPGFAAAAWCQTITNNPQVFNDPPRAVFEVEEDDQFFCLWFNVPGEDNDIDIFKWVCPEGTGHDEDIDWYFDTCTTELDGIGFKTTSDLGIAVLDTVGGMVGFGGFPAGMEVGIQELIPDEYGEPVVICGSDGVWSVYPAPAGFIEHTFENSGETFTCHWFNIPGEPPSITVLKWTCPPGYDLMAAGADPSVDCTDATNGVTFELRLEGNPALVESQATGDEIDGGVVFDDLEPDVYNIAELMPDGIANAFILECTGHIMGMLQPYPLQFGPVLDDIDLDAGEHLVCHWYNVPEGNGGDLTLIKYTCGTEEFVSEVDCQIEEDGKTFNLLAWDGDSWEGIDTAVTDGFGRIGWTGLEPGDYWLDEHEGEWCHLASEQLADDDTSLAVEDGQETIVHVYNCDDEPGQPGDTPTKYPNTGVPPESSPDGSGQATAVRVGFLDVFGAGFELYGPFAGIVGLMIHLWHTIDTRNRIARDRERTEERRWDEEEAARQDRPAWLASAPARTARPAWMTASDASPRARPSWMTRRPIDRDDPGPG